MRLYIVSTCLWKIWWPTWYDMFKVTHRHDLVNKKVYRHPSFSVWTRAWTRLVVDTLRGNMSVEPKQRKLSDKLYTDTSSHEKICMRTRPRKSKSCAEGRYFTVNTHHSPLRGSNQWSLTWFRMWKVAYIRLPMWKFAPGDVLVSQNSAESVLVKNCTLSHLTVDTTCRDTSH